MLPIQNLTKPISIVSFLVTIFLQPSCGVKPHSPNKQKPAQPPALDLTADIKSIQENIINKNCISCHGKVDPDDGLDLTDISSLIGKKSNLIKPQQPENSLIYTEIASGAMPPSKTENLDNNTVNIIKEWILKLNPNDFPEGKTHHEHEEHEDDGDHHQEEGSDNGDSAARPQIEANLASVQNWVNAVCLECHDKATKKNNYTDLRDISKLIRENTEESSTGIERKIITPNKPYASLFYVSMDEAKTEPNKLMPENDEKVELKTLETIRKWIESLPPLEEIDRCEQDPDNPDCEVPIIEN